MSESHDEFRPGFAGRITRAFADNAVTPILILLAVGLGVVALVLVPREEEPQIPVPLVDILVPAPGWDPEHALETITRPLEDIVSGIKGVDHVYSRTRAGLVIVSVRYFPGTDSDNAVLRITERLGANNERKPPGIPEPLVVGRGIEDVAVLTLTLSPELDAVDRYDRAALYELAEALRWRMSRIERVGLTYVVGSGPAELRVEPDPDALALWGVDPLTLQARIQAANRVRELDRLAARDTRHPARLGRTLASPEALADLLVTTRDGRPIYVRDLARVILGPPQPGALVWQVDSDEPGEPRPAATLAVAKRPGANGVTVAEQALKILARSRDELIPGDVQVWISRNYGESAAANARTLLLQLLSATGVIVVLIGLFVGLREALVSLVAIPTTILLTFFALWLMGYTINRVSLFALIFAIGILVDDAIVVVENITRWWQRGEAERLGAAAAAVRAVDEVGNPTIVSTLTIIAALLPMLAVSGLMGPYMSPIPANASAAVVFSTAVALTVTPWLMLRLRHLDYRLDWLSGGDDARGGRLGGLYLRLAEPLLASRRRALALILGVSVATVASFGLFFTVTVPVKLLPYDDKRELQVVLNLPETATLERTDGLLRDIVERLRDMPEIDHLQLHAGTAAPFNFNGLVRQYYLRNSPELGDVQIRLRPAGERERQSHEVALDVRQRLRDLPLPAGAALRVVETPPGPPVFATLLAEIYGPDAASRRRAARAVRAAYEAVPFIVDVDDSRGAVQARVRFEIDRAALDLYGVAEATVQDTLQGLLAGRVIGQGRGRLERGATDIVMALNRADRVPEERLLAVPVAGRNGVVELGQVVKMYRESVPRQIFRRNGRSLIMVQGNLAGEREAPLYGMLAVQEKLAGTAPDLTIRLRGQPLNPDSAVLLWHGEWEITYTTFRDMGMAFAVAFLVIYAIVVQRFSRFRLPLVIMVPVPLTLLGVVLGHALMGAKFTATSMIGFIALAGIVVRNSILLVEFIETERAAGSSVREAVLKASAVRFRPIFLTALTAMVGAAFIMTDPIFKGLAVSLFFGLISSTLLTPLIIPALYIRRHEGRGTNA